MEPRVGFGCASSSRATRIRHTWSQSPAAGGIPLFVTYDLDVDALYVKLAAEGVPVAETDELDDRRFVDYDERGAVYGVELLHASLGINLAGLPEAARIADAIRSLPGLASALTEAPPAA